MRSLTNLLDKVCGPMVFALQQRHLENIKQIEDLKREKTELETRLRS